MRRRIVICCESRQVVFLQQHLTYGGQESLNYNDCIFFVGQDEITSVLYGWLPSLCCNMTRVNSGVFLEAV